jgi:hypothetical protein
MISRTFCVLFEYADDLECLGLGRARHGRLQTCPTGGRLTSVLGAAG